MDTSLQPRLYSAQELSVIFADSIDKFVDDESVGTYLHRLLERNVSLQSEGSHRMLQHHYDDPEKAFNDACTVRKWRSGSRTRAEAYSDVKGLGDMLLFTCGFVPESLVGKLTRNSGLGLRFYIGQGSSAYSTVSDILDGLTDAQKLLLSTTTVPSQQLTNEDLVLAMDSDIFSYLSIYFVGAANTLYAVRQDMTDTMWSGDREINSAVYEETGNEAAETGVNRDVKHLPKRSNSPRG